MSNITMQKNKIFTSKFNKKPNKQPYKQPQLVKLEKNNLTEIQKKMVNELERQLRKLKEENSRK